MKTKNSKRHILHLFTTIFLIAVLSVVCFCATFSPIALAEDSSSATSESAQQPPLRWINWQPRICWTFGGDYSPLSFTDREITYYPNSGGTNVFGGYVNEEIFALTANYNSNTSSTRLSPLGSLSSPANLTATGGSVTVTFEKVIEPRGSCVFLKHTRKLKNLCNDLKIPGCNTQVSYGRVLYRQSNGNITSAGWNYTNLSNDTVISFTLAHGQIAVIYALNEKGYHIGDTNKHFFLVGIYTIDIV